MADAYLGEIRIFGFEFMPRYWVFCMGQPLQIADFQALYAVIGDTYGGDGRTTMGVPDLRARAPLHFGASTGPGLLPHRLGELGGFPYKRIDETNMPAHSHSVNAVNADATEVAPSEELMLAMGKISAGPPARRKKNMYADYDAAAITQLNDDAVVKSSGQAVEEIINYQPFQAMNFCMCVDGLFPPRP